MAVDFKDYYKILGVSRDVDEKALRQTYRKLARQYHPDVNPDDKAAEEKFKEINEANEVLADPEKRKKYDEMLDYYERYGQWPGAAGQASGAGSTSGFGNFNGFGNAGNGNFSYYTVSPEDMEDLFGGNSPFSDFFETYFHSGFGSVGADSNRGSRYATRRATPGQDVESEVEVTLAEAYQGVTRTFELTDPAVGSRRLEVKIPAGVDEGSRIRVSGQGLQGTAGRGNLYLRVHLAPDTKFRREGTTLHTSVDVPLTTAMLGGEIQVETPDGRRLLLRIPEETTNGKSFRLRGQGMPQLNQPDIRGDLYADVHVVLPAHLTAEQRQLFAAFARSLEEK